MSKKDVRDMVLLALISVLTLIAGLAIIAVLASDSDSVSFVEGKTMPSYKPYKIRFRPEQKTWSINGPDGTVGTMAMIPAIRLAGHLNRAFGLGAEWIVEKTAIKMKKGT